MRVLPDISDFPESDGAEDAVGHGFEYATKVDMSNVEDELKINIAGAYADVYIHSLKSVPEIVLEP